MAIVQPPCCATCDFFKHPHEVDRVVVARSGVEPPGFCQRYPQTLPKGPADWCGEWVQEDNPADAERNG